jgi:hypothetical protein
MSYTTDGLFRPLRPGDFQPRRIIQQGGQTSGSYTKGIQDLALNQLALWARTAPIVIQDAKHAIVACDDPDVPYVFAFYRHFMPCLLNDTAATGRRFLQVEVTAKAAAGTEWTPYLYTDAQYIVGTPSDTSGAVQTTFSLVQIDGDQPDFLILYLSRKGGDDEIDVFEVTARVFQMPAGALGTLGNVAGEHFSPVDSTLEPVATRALTVQMAQALVEANQNLHERNGRSIVSYCQWCNWGPTAFTPVVSPLHVFTFSRTNLNQAESHEWVYFPRPGVRRLRVFCDAYMIGHVSEEGRLRLGFDGLDDSLEIEVEKGVAFDAFNWSMSGGYLNVPQGASGPLFLSLVRTDRESPDIKILSLTVQEEIE